MYSTGVEDKRRRNEIMLTLPIQMYRKIENDALAHGIEGKEHLKRKRLKYLSMQFAAIEKE